MVQPRKTNIHALLFGLSEDLAGELLAPLQSCAVRVEAVHHTTSSIRDVADSTAQIIFCGADVNVVSELRNANPAAPIVVVSRHAEVNDWLDSMEAGATDYCAAPFETAQLQWILETSMRSVPSFA
jgi:DNA-binding NtrC family response regulator